MEQARIYAIPLGLILEATPSLEIKIKSQGITPSPAFEVAREPDKITNKIRPNKVASVDDEDEKRLILKQAVIAYDVIGRKNWKCELCGTLSNTPDQFVVHVNAIKHKRVKSKSYTRLHILV